MELKDIQSDTKSKEELLTSVKISKEDKIFIFENNIVLKKLVQEAIEELRRNKDKS